MVQGSHFGFRTLPELSGETVTASAGSAATDRDPLIERVLCDSSVLGEVCARLRDEPVVPVQCPPLVAEQPYSAEHGLIETQT